MTGSLPPADPAMTTAAVAETDAARKNAAALAQTLMAKTCPGTGNAYLTRKGFPGRECRMLTGTHRAGGVAGAPVTLWCHCMTTAANWLSLS